MVRLFEFLIHGCWHDWCVRSAGDLVAKVGRLAHGTRYIYQCEKCHRIKKQDVI
jgi:cytochrome c2